jgi:hypothetical protein
VARIHLLFGLTALCLALPGCSGPPTVLLATPNGPQTLYAPSPAMPNGAVPPPPGLTAPPSQPVSRNGTYTGTASVLSTYGNQCQETVPVVGFRVRGNKVRFGRFYGTIDPSDGLQMTYDTQWIVGQFEGATFHGQVTFWGRSGPGCTYLLNLQRTSA